MSFKKFIRPEKFKNFEYLKTDKLDIKQAKNKMSKDTLQLPKTAFSMKASLQTKNQKF